MKISPNAFKLLDRHKNRLIGLFISVKFQFHENISNDFQTQGRTKTTVFIVQRAIMIPKVVKPQLWLLSSAYLQTLMAYSNIYLEDSYILASFIDL